MKARYRFFMYNILSFTILVLILAANVAEGKVKMKMKKPGKGGPKVKKNNTTHTHKQGYMGPLIASNPFKAWGLILVGQILMGIAFSYYFNHQYIHHKSK